MRVRHVRQHAREKLQRIHRLGPRRRAVRLVGAVAHAAFRRVVLGALERDGIARAVAREPERKRDIALRHEHRIVHVKPRVRPRQHPLGVLALEQSAPHEQSEDGAAKGFRQRRGVMRGLRDERGAH